MNKEDPDRIAQIGQADLAFTVYIYIEGTFFAWLGPNHEV